MASDGSQVVLVLCGLVGAGKSTFATALEHHFPAFQRCNQDDLGDRRAVERKAREALGQGLSVCIDRTNFDERQRATWIGIASEFPNVTVWCLNLTIPKETCRDRLFTRTNHPTIGSYEEGLQVLENFSNLFRPPTFDEGFSRIYDFSSTQASYTKEDIQTILSEIENSPPPPKRLRNRNLGDFGFGSGSGVFRGRGRGRTPLRGRGEKAPPRRERRVNHDNE